MRVLVAISLLLSIPAQSASSNDWGLPDYKCTGVIYGLVNPKTNLHGWRIADVSGKYQCTVPTGQQFSDITPCREGGMCEMLFTHHRIEPWGAYGVTEITVLEEPLYYVPTK